MISDPSMLPPRGAPNSKGNYYDYQRREGVKLKRKFMYEIVKDLPVSTRHIKTHHMKSKHLIVPRFTMFQ